MAYCGGLSGGYHLPLIQTRPPPCGFIPSVGDTALTVAASLSGSVGDHCTGVVARSRSGSRLFPAFTAAIAACCAAYSAASCLAAASSHVNGTFERRSISLNLLRASQTTMRSPSFRQFRRLKTSTLFFSKRSFPLIFRCLKLCATSAYKPSFSTHASTAGTVEFRLISTGLRGRLQPATPPDMTGGRSCLVPVFSLIPRTTAQKPRTTKQNHERD